MLAIINIARMCQNFNCLPDSGGLLDQDPDLINAISWVYQADADKAERERKAKKSVARKK